MTSPRKDWIVDALRWAGSAAAVIAAYALVGWLILFRSPPVVDDGGGQPAVEIDLQPVPATAAEPPSDAPPGPPQPQAESHAQEASQQQVEKTDNPTPPPQGADAQLPDPEKPVVEQQAPPAPAIEAPQPTAPESIEAPPGPSVQATPGQTERPPSRAVLTWQRVLVSRLERAKRYPTQAGGREGATTIAFTIDHSGRLTESHVVRSSGSSALDDATVDLLKRAQPFPDPPHDMAGERLTFVVTLRYER